MFLMPRWFCIKLSLHHVRCSSWGSIWAKFRPQNGPEIDSKTLYKTSRNFNRKNDAKRPRSGSQNGSKIALFLRRRGPGFQPSGSWASNLRFDAVWDPFGVDFGSILARFGAVWDRFGSVFGPFWSKFGLIWDRLCIIFGWALHFQFRNKSRKSKKENKNQQQPDMPEEPPTDNLRRASRPTIASSKS